MLADDIVFVVRKSTFSRDAAILIDDIIAAQIIKRFNAVGAWNITLPNDLAVVQKLKLPGSGIIVYYKDEVFVSGPMIAWTKTETQDDPIGTTQFVGADDMVYLADATAYPTPSTDDVAQQTSAYDVRTGPAETIMKQYVRANIGSNAPTARRTPVGFPIVIGPDLARGAVSQYSARFDQLGAVLNSIASAVGMGYDCLYDDAQQRVVFDVYTPLDRTGTVRMDISNDLLSSTQSGVSAPTTTRAIVAGQGQAEERKFIEVNDTDSLAAETLWRRRIETFIDQRNTNDDDELTQSGTEVITANGRTIASLKIVPSDSSTMVFGKDWFIGDMVAIIVDDQVISDTVTEAIIAISSDDVAIGASIGDPVGYDWESVITDKIARHEQRIAFLEKNS